MKLKYIKLLNVAAIISALLGIFLIGCGLFEFTGILKTNANTSIEAGGIQLSYLVFTSGILVFVSGLAAFLDRKEMRFINLHIFIAAASLAWPVFVSLVLFFTQLTICVRLIPTTLSSLFYIISVMIVKIGNDTLRRSHKFNPMQSVEALTGIKRKAGVDVSMALKSGGKRKTGVDVSMALKSGGKRKTGMNVSNLFRPGRRAAAPKVNIGHAIGGMLRPASGRRGGLSFLYSGQRKRGGLRLRSRYK